MNRKKAISEIPAANGEIKYKMVRYLRYKLNLKIFFFFILIIFTMTISSIIIGYKVVIKTVENEIHSKLSGSISAYSQEIKFIEQNDLRIARHLSEDKEIIGLLNTGQYNRLEQKLRDYFIMKIVDIIEIESPEGKVIRRGHNPEMAGDIKIQQSIIRTGLSGKSVVSYEKGRSGFAIRAVSPISYNNRIIGLIMAGSRFSKNFVDHIRALTGIDNGIYRDDDKIISTYSGYKKISSNTVKKLKAGKIIFIDKAVLNNEKSYLILKPLFSANENYWGALCMAISVKAESKFLIYYRKLLIFMIGLGVILSLILYFFLAKNINQSLRKIISGIDGFLINDFTTRINLDGNDEFSKIADSFNKLARKLQLYNNRIIKLQEDMVQSAKLAAAGQLAAGLAHEIRNPLSSIKMMTQIMREKLKGDGNRKEITIILNEIERINHIVKELIEFAKPSAMHFQNQNINDIIINLLNLFKYRIEHQGIEVEQDLPETLPEIPVDTEKIKVCIINIIVNAVQAMPRGGILSTSTGLSGSDNILIRICDTGEGIEQSFIKNIFEPFFTTKREGTGLGLALAKVIIERHQGHIYVKSNKNGTCFTILLPLKHKDTDMII
ncbi:MAG: hypothetical protein GXP33_09480 [Spirochaetes bacterium]|nr:hypothetical protein [Spirochaetota bacterium]